MMARPPRLQFPGATYHIVTRGDGRRTLFRDDGHYRRLTKGLADEVLRSDPEDYVGFRSLAAGREMAALVCRRYTSVTLAELSERLGLRHPDSSANLVRRAKQRGDKSTA